MNEKGRILIFTGDGKGKTTAALGMALRAHGHGIPVAIIQFVKSDVKTGEFAVLSVLRRVPTRRVLDELAADGESEAGPGDELRLADRAIVERAAVLGYLRQTAFGPGRGRVAQVQGSGQVGGHQVIVPRVPVRNRRHEVHIAATGRNQSGQWTVDSEDKMKRNRRADSRISYKASATECSRENNKLSMSSTGGKSRRAIRRKCSESPIASCGASRGRRACGRRAYSISSWQVQKKVPGRKRLPQISRDW